MTILKHPTVKLIIALDFDNAANALALVEQLDPTQCALKVGSEMFTLLGMDFVRKLVTRQYNVFLDLKFHDIPNTVARACSVAADNGVWMLTLHAAGGFQMMDSARKAIDLYGVTRPLLVAVTVLTSMPAAELPGMGIGCSLEEHVCALALLAEKSGCDGVVSSALEVPMIKAACGANFLAITPGIRRDLDKKDDQARIVTPEMALLAGSDYLVVGRPITRALDPALALQHFLTVMH